MFQPSPQHLAMGRGKELTPQMRSRICELRAQGYKFREIHAVHPEISLSTIKSTVYKESKRKDNRSLPRPGQPRKITAEQRDQIYDTIAHENPHVTNQELLDAMGNPCQKRALQSLKRELGR